ncbi:MAG TPA: tRNA guanosine(34) transglycosylase Tgt [Thermoanaerobaculia bacterium]|nr:tRNA guanosine(34) transglycosylase Tgt [Thermoanaerobaculia bacterium]
MENRAEFFAIDAADRPSCARRARLFLTHATVETPAFMPVGTLGAVKAIPFDLLESWDCRLILANTYHLMLRPGLAGMRRAGGLHRFTSWRRGLLTDSGGFQVMSLAAQREISEEGVRFRSHLDGTEIDLTPELAMELQSAFGTDVAMCLDVCPSFPAPRSEVESAVARTTRWADRCRRAWRGPGALFGIVQGGTHDDLRRRSAEEITALDFAGYAIGGVAVGEEKAEIERIAAATAALLPRDRPRYLMGVGTPADLLAAVRAGIDLFDCVLPTRNGRMGHAYTSEGSLAIKNARHGDDDRPLDARCGCPVCGRHSRGYLRHLFVLRDITAPVLISIHNVYFYLDWMRAIREAISEGRLASLAAPPDEKASA